MEIERLNVDSVRKYGAQLQALMKDLLPFYGCGDAAEKYGAMARFIAEKSAVVFAAVNKGAVAGYIWGYRRQAGDKGRTHVTQFVVGSGCRQRGVGKRLLEEMKRYAGENGLQAIELNVLANNWEGIRFYLKNGFVCSRLFMTLQRHRAMALQGYRGEGWSHVSD